MWLNSFPRRTVSPPGEEAGGEAAPAMNPAQPPDHLCLFYLDPSQLWPLVVSFLQTGLEAGERCLTITEEHPPEAVVAALEAHGLAAGECLQQRRLVIQRADESKLTAFPFSPDQAVHSWQAAAETAVNDGLAGLRLVVDMSWALRGASSLAQLAEYEARAGQCFAGSSINALCHYNQHRFPEVILLDALRTHPRVALEGSVHDNQFHLPPDLFLQQDRRAQFYWYLSRLHPAPALTSTPGTGMAPAAKASPWEAAKRRRPAAQAHLQMGDDGRLGEGEASPNWRWQVYCLGELRVQRHDGTPVNWNAAKGAATKKIKTLFAYLMECGKTGASMEQLADLLWPDAADGQKALGRLYHTVHALRAALEPDLTNGRASRHLLIRDGRCFLLLPDETWVDATAFEQFCYRGERLIEAGDDDNALACYLAADKLYAGDLLADIPLAYAERTDDDWCWSRRYWLQEMYLKLLVGLAAIHRRRGAVQEALGHARRALALDPCNEAAHREMMLDLHRAGRPDALVRQYEICQQVLRRSESGPPDAETTRLYEELMQAIGRRA